MTVVRVLFGTHWLYLCGVTVLPPLLMPGPVFVANRKEAHKYETLTGATFALEMAIQWGGLDRLKYEILTREGRTWTRTI